MTKVLIAILLPLVSLSQIVGAAAMEPYSVRKAVIITGKQSTSPELKGADMLRTRIMKRSQIEIKSAIEGTDEAKNAIGWADGFKQTEKKDYSYILLG